MIVIFKLVFVYIGLRLSIWLGASKMAGIASGLLIGHTLDYIATRKFRNWQMQRMYKAHAKAEFNSRFINSLFLLLGKICVADGVVSKSEIGAVESLMETVFNFDRKTKKLAISTFRSVRNNPRSVQSCAIDLFELYQSLPEMYDSIVQMCLNIATADGPLNEAEEKMIRTVATVFGMDDSKYRAFVAPYFRSSSDSGPAAHGLASSIEKSYSVLGCTPTDSVEDIKKKYRKLVSDYHPDKIVSKELPEEFTKFANEKFKNIQAAYESVKAQRGFN